MPGGQYREASNVASLFTENGAQQFFLRRKRGFTFRSDLADQDVPGPHGRADANDAAFIEVAEEHLADVGNIARDLFRAELRVARLDFVLFDVDGRVVVVLDQLLADQDGVFEVVAAPGKECHQDVAPQRQFATLGARPVSQHLALTDAIAHADQRLLVDAGVLV